MRGTLVAGGGIHTADDVVKALLTGAHAVQIVSALLRHGPEVLPTRIKELHTWMEHHHFETIDQFRGALNLRACGDPGAFERANYIAVLQSRTN